MYERPGKGYYATATKATAQNAPCVEDGIVGTAQKQTVRGWASGLVGQATIDIGERFHIRTKGERQVPNTGIAAAAKGAAIYIVTATNALATVNTGAIPFGRIISLPGDSRGVPTGMVRIDLDQKDTILA